MAFTVEKKKSRSAVSDGLRPIFIVALTVLALGCYSNKGDRAPASSSGGPGAASPAAARAAAAPPAGRLRLNHLQVKGTHNSYHRRPAFSLVREHDRLLVPIIALTVAFLLTNALQWSKI